MLLLQGALFHTDPCNTHIRRPYECSGCRKPFPGLVSLKRTSGHAGERPHKCSICGRDFGSLATVKDISEYILERNTLSAPAARILDSQYDRIDNKKKNAPSILFENDSTYTMNNRSQTMGSNM